MLHQGSAPSSPYDVENRLLTKTSTTDGQPNISLTYDPEGRLSSYTSGTTTTTFLYDGTNLIAEYNAAGTLLRRYIHGDGVDEPIVWIEGAGSTDRRYLITNYQGSIIGYTDAAGNLATVYKYGAYGEPKDISNNDSWSGSRFRYTGQTMLPEARLYYYKARVYDPVYGHFMQTDPIGSKDDLDLYAYVKDDPVNGTDPTGLCGPACPVMACMATPPCAAAMAATGAAVVYYGAKAVQALGDYIHLNENNSGPIGGEVAPGTGSGSGAAAPSPNDPDQEEKPRSRASKMQNEVKKGQAPKDVKRVDSAHQPDQPGSKDHVHFKDGTSMNNDGTIHDAHNGTPNPTNKVMDWLKAHGWGS